MSLSVNNLQKPLAIEPNLASPSVKPGEAQKNFANVLKSAIEEVNDAQVISDKKTEALARGEIDDLHDVMITAQKASITLETTVQVQRKVIDAYNEIMRMQV
ncbi:flagellar hook-basal body complex protein FliE [Ornithinibacillus sp. L9]|uniref:Flagellar hook-basal body complex protein FliE n=1 Tax=Ornithinibacillus caprae TaxID=2678566 RepID=A0A6N8FPW1_9BACI|nr:flagellar hook-basal body complex protein FliE [Ornithinibacillus caprae]MUK89919.1 flagellar hook-basal body complex protein FliE [Ornithinibacillus caprae]